MRIAEVTVRRPLATLMGVLIILVLGVVSLSRLPIDLYPQMSLPYAVCIANYEGAGPQEVERLVTQPLEEALGTVRNIKGIMSSSQPGSAMVMMEFEWGTDMDFAALEMREKLDMIAGFLPEGVDKPMVFQADPAMEPIMILSLSGNLDQVRLKETAQELVKRHLERVEGIASVSVTGGRERTILLEVDPYRLASYDLSMTSLQQALAANNLNLPGGTIAVGGKELLIRTTGEFTSLEEIGAILIPTGTGGMVRLDSLATIIDGYKDVRQISTTNQQPSVGINIQKQSTANTVQVAQAVRRAIAKLEKELPAGVVLTTVFDQARFIEQSIGTVSSSAIYGALLAILVLWFFLRSLRPTLVIATAIPISIIATFILLYFNKLTLNMMSLGGLALGVGMLVDNSIVVLENIFRYREEGASRTAAAIQGTHEVAAAITASTLTTIAVFLPVVFIEGLVSEIFRQLALTVTFSLLASLVVAVTFVPALAAKLLGRRLYLPPSQIAEEEALLVAAKGSGGGAGKKSNTIKELISSIYLPLLKWALSHRKLTVAAAGVTLVICLGLLPTIGSNFMPPMDEGSIRVSVNMPVGTALEETTAVLQQVEEVVARQPEVATIFASAGGGQNVFGSGSSEVGSLNVELVPRAERKRTPKEIIAALRKEIGEIPGATVSFAEGGLGMMLGGGAPIQIKIFGDDLPTLAAIAEQIETRLEKLPEIAQTSNSLAVGRPELQIQLKRDLAATYGLSVTQVASQVRGAISGQTATRYRIGGDEIDVTLRLPKAERESLSNLKGLLISAPTGAQVPLATVADLVTARGPQSIARENQQRTVSVTGTLTGANVGGAQRAIQAELAKIDLPMGYSLKYGGEAEEMVKAFGDLGLALILAIFLVYMVMVIQYESLLYPFVIMFTLPLAFIGVIFALVLTGKELSVPAYIGVIMLTGIVVNNAIVMVDYINQLRAKGLSRQEAILVAGPTRLRPVLMTSLTTILGLVPMALGIGEGAEMQAPLAIVVIGGLLVGTFLTLVIIPVFYTLIEDLATRMMGWFGYKKGESVKVTG